MVLGKLLKNRRAGQDRLAWNAPNLAGPDTLDLRSPDFGHEANMPIAHAAKRVGGKELSPALAWAAAPEGTATLLLVMEDVDVPLGSPFVHCVAAIDGSVTELAQGALDAKNPGAGVRVLRSGLSRGYLGPAPIKGHGPHRYVFQLFALARPVDTALDTARPRELLATIDTVLARGRLDGLYERP